MTRRSREVGIIKSCILAAALIAGLTATAYADNKLTLSGSASFTTDYMFRSVSNTNNDPAVQPEIDLGYGIFWAYMWGSNTVYGKNIEIDYGGGISPKWNDITFTVGGLVYTYPGADSSADYFELKSGATWAKGPWSIGVNDWWSPNFAQAFGQSNAIEGDIGYTFPNWKIWNFFTPGISGAVGFQSFDHTASDYTYWNVGMTFAFMKVWSADIRYYDTNYNETQCFIEQGFDKHACDARAVGTIKVTF
jgi:uncharacterized protein (TIGR02001 family)